VYYPVWPSDTEQFFCNPNSHETDISSLRMPIELDAVTMLNDALLSRTGRTAVGCDDRRGGDRLPFPAEVVVLWHYDLATSVRYRVMDVSDGGMRIRSSMPIMEGTTGMAVKLLPDGQALDRAVMVCWSRPVDGESSYDVGLHFI